MSDVNTDSTKDAHARRFGVPKFRRHAAREKFFTGVLVVASLAGSVGFAVPAKAGTTTTTTTLATTTTIFGATTTTTVASSSCGVNDGSGEYIQCEQQLAGQAACPDLGITVASMTSFFGATVQLVGEVDESSYTISDPIIYKTQCGIGNFQNGEDVTLLGSVTLAHVMSVDLFKTTKGTATVGSLKAHCHSTCVIQFQSVAGFGTGAEDKVEYVAAGSGFYGKPTLEKSSYELIAPVGNRVLVIGQGSHVWSSLQSFLSFAHVVYQAAIANA